MKNPATALFAIQTAFANLMETIEEVAQSISVAPAILKQEAQEVIRMFVAASVLSDSALTEGEQEFIALFVNWNQQPGEDDPNYLAKYSALWGSSYDRIPGFLEAAVQSDRSNGTAHASAILRELQLIGNNASVSDGEFLHSEYRAVQNYIARLEEYLQGGEPQHE